MVVVFDLDDTLYNEIDFVKSGFWEVSRYLKDKRYFDYMLELFFEQGSGKIFDELIKKFNLNVSLQKLIEIYRFHFPFISLPEESREVLSSFNKKSLITDGHYITQYNKFRALGLDLYISNPIFTDFFHTKKPDKKPFLMVMEMFKDKEYVYIADNPSKDFFAPKELGWFSIRIKNPVGIYKDLKNNADVEVENILEVLKVLK